DEKDVMGSLGIGGRGRLEVGSTRGDDPIFELFDERKGAIVDHSVLLARDDHFIVLIVGDVYSDLVLALDRDGEVIGVFLTLGDDDSLGILLLEDRKEVLLLIHTGIGSRDRPYVDVLSFVFDPGGEGYHLPIIHKRDGRLL